VNRFARERVLESRDKKPGEEGEELWSLHKENLDGSEPRYCYSNAPADLPILVLARVAMGRWPIETEFDGEKSLLALDEYEVRSWAGWHHQITMSMLASAFLLTLQQAWGKSCPKSPGRRCSGWSTNSYPQKRWTPAEVLD
jgi:SRSO17 transposase